MFSNGKIYSFVGPIASGKTTQRKMLKKYLDEYVSVKVFSFNIPPFIFISDLLLCFLRLILDRTKIPVKKYITNFAYFEQNFPKLLIKLINFIIILDSLQLLIFTFLFRSMIVTGAYLILEDYPITNIIEYQLYYESYNKRSIFENKYFLFFIKILTILLTNMILYIYLNPNKKIRYIRSKKRGKNIVRLDLAHDKIREKKLYEYLDDKNYNLNTIIVNNSEQTVKETFKEIILKLNLGKH
jgi:hypothetical protein